MKNFVYYINEKNEMEEFFEKRTNKHINLVKKYAKEIESNFPNETKGLIDQAEKHDQSKFELPEKDPYILLSWNKENEKNGKSLNLKKIDKDNIAKATLHHIQNNKHHPEFWDPNKDKLTIKQFNIQNRDKLKDKINNATEMDNISMAEMIADWLAMGEELGNTAKSWADKNVNKRWKFNNKQTNFINEILDKIETKRKATI